MQEYASQPATAIIDHLRSQLRGAVIGPGDPEYDDARTVFYSGMSRRPAAIARPVDAADVVPVISYARECGAPVAVRGGGHSLAGHGGVEGGIVVDLSALRSLEVDVAGRTAWAGGGLTAGEYTAAVGAHKLATGFGDSPSVGIGGITLGGGIGLLHRKLGLTLDSVLAAEIVTASGEVLEVNADSHPQLFWAIRGGGGNFGVVTRIRYRLHEVDEVVGGMMILPADADRIARFMTFLQEAPEELSGMTNVMLAPPMPFIPPEHHGQPIILAALVHVGAADAGERALAPFRAIGPPIVDMIQPTRYAAIYEGEGEPPRPTRMAAHSFFTDQVDRAVGDAVLDHLHRSSAQMKVAQFRTLGGAVGRIPADATAFAHRQRAMTAIAGAAYDDPADAAEHEAWAAGLAADVRRGGPGAYVGFLGKETEARVREAYPGTTWERLRKVKAEYDPTNLFSLNQNIPPASVP